MWKNNLTLRKYTLTSGLLFFLLALSVAADNEEVKGAVREKYHIPPLEEAALGFPFEQESVSNQRPPTIVDNLANLEGSCFGCSREEARRAACFLNPCQLSYLRPTAKRIAGLVGTAALSTAAGLLYWYFTPLVFLNLIDSVGAFVVINGTETMLSTMALFHKMPSKIKMVKTPANMLEKMAVVIPVHGKDKDIRPTLESFLQAGISYQQIFVMENTGGRYRQEDSKTFALMQDAAFSEIGYRFISDFGNKVAAVMLGAVWAKRQGYTYMLSADDDVIVEKDFDPMLPLLTKKVTMVMFPIEPTKQINWLEWMQGIEYRQSDMHNYFKAAALGAAFAPHGAGSVSTIDAFIENVGSTNMRFMAEDQVAGAAFRASGGAIEIARAPTLKTEVPSNCCSWWNQRAGSWNIGEQKMSGLIMRDIATNGPENCAPSELVRSAIREAYLLQSLWGNISGVIRPFVMVSLASHWFFWTMVGAVWEARNLIGITYDTLYKPFNEGKKVCVPRQLRDACIAHHSSCFYTCLQMLASTAGACCAWIGAGAGRDEDFAILRKGPKELRRIFKIGSREERWARLDAYAQRVAPDPRRPIRQAASLVGSYVE